MAVMNVVLARSAIPLLRSIRLYPGGGFSPQVASVGTVLLQGFVAVVAFVSFNSMLLFMVAVLIKAFTGGYSER
jgi:hypothetical protein